MNRFILYSGLVHGALFIGALTYLATGHQDAMDPNVQSVVELELPTAATKDVPAVEAPQPSEAQQKTSHPSAAAAEVNKSEVRERKVRASLPSAPSVPRIVERMEKATGDKLPTTLPEKVKPATQMAAAPAYSSSPVAEDVDPEIKRSEDATLSEMDALAAKHLEDLNQGEDAPSIAPISNEIEKGSASQKMDTPEGASNNDPSNGEAKALSEFIQRPGNKRPEYETLDRREGRQGLVVFQAYVTATGQPKDFQLVTSSGHRSLDLKTLKALRTWQFLAGQEGWVEIPFRWDLRGGVQEAPSTLRRMNRTAN